MITISKIIKITTPPLILSLILTLTTKYGIVTYLTRYSEPYSSDDQLLKSFNLDSISDKEKAWQIYSNVESQLKHKFTYYSFFENPVSVIFEMIIFEPLYKVIAGKKSEFLNTLREPYLLFNAGGGICSQSAIAMVKLAEKVGFKGRVIWLKGHSVSEIYYDNAWHLFDANMGIIFKENDHILSYDEIINKPDLIHDTLEKQKLENEIQPDYPFTVIEPRQIADMYLTTHDNYFYHFHPYEIYIEVYYFLTRLASYMLYILFFLGLVFFMKKVSKFWLITDK